MPPKRARAEGHSDDQSEGGAPAVPRKRQRKAAAAANARNEYTEDPGREQSRNLLGWGEWQKNVKQSESRKANAFMKNFEDGVRQQKDEVLRDLADLEGMRMSWNEGAANQIRQLTREELASLVTKTQHPRYAKQQKTLAMYRSVIETYHNAEAQVKAQGVAISWEQRDEDAAKMTQVIQYGQKMASAIVQGIVVPTFDVSGILNMSEESLDETGAVAMGLLKDSREALVTTKTWASHAQAQIRAMAGLAKVASSDKL